MSQKSSVPQAASFVSVVLKRDTNQRHFDYVWYRTFRWTLTPTKSRVQLPAVEALLCPRAAPKTATCRSLRFYKLAALMPSAGTQ